MTSRDLFTIRRAEPAEYPAVGRLTVSVYQALAGMPRLHEQPEYYAMLADTVQRASWPGTEILVAVENSHPGQSSNLEDPSSSLMGAVTFVGEMASYGSGGRASQCKDAAGIRLLGVAPDARRKGVGRALARACIQKARALGSARVVLHSTKAMAVAWALYLDMGFCRCPELDFMQKELPVFGFELKLTESITHRENSNRAS